MSSSTPIADGRVSALVDKHVTRQTAASANRADAEADDTDALFAELEAEDDSAYRAARVQQLSEELKKFQPAAVVETSRGEKEAAVMTLTSDDDVLQFTTRNEKVVIHFFHADFARCAIMDRHLQAVAQAQGVFGSGDAAERVRFGRVNVKDASFVVERLGVRVLPCVVGFIDGVGVGRVVGFEGLVWGGRETSREVARALEAKMVEWAVLKHELLGRNQVEESESEDEEKKGTRKSIRGPMRTLDADDEDWD